MEGKSQHSHTSAAGQEHQDNSQENDLTRTNVRASVADILFSELCTCEGLSLKPGVRGWTGDTRVIASMDQESVGIPESHERIVVSLSQESVDVSVSHHSVDVSVDQKSVDVSVDQKSVGGQESLDGSRDCDCADSSFDQENLEVPVGLMNLQASVGRGKVDDLVDHESVEDCVGQNSVCCSVCPESIPVPVEHKGKSVFEQESAHLQTVRRFGDTDTLLEQNSVHLQNACIVTTEAHPDGSSSSVDDIPSNLPTNGEGRGGILAKFNSLSDASVDESIRPESWGLSSRICKRFVFPVGGCYVDCSSDASEDRESFGLFLVQGHTATFDKKYEGFEELMDASLDGETEKKAGPGDIHLIALDRTDSLSDDLADTSRGSTSSDSEGLIDASIDGETPVPEDVVDASIDGKTPFPEDVVDASIDGETPVPEDVVDASIDGETPVPEDVVEASIDGETPVPEDVIDASIDGETPVPEDVYEASIDGETLVPEDVVEASIDGETPVSEDVVEASKDGETPVPEDVVDVSIDGETTVPENVMGPVIICSRLIADHANTKHTRFDGPGDMPGKCEKHDSPIADNGKVIPFPSDKSNNFTNSTVYGPKDRNFRGSDLRDIGPKDLNFRCPGLRDIGPKDPNFRCPGLRDIGPKDPNFRCPGLRDIGPKDPNFRCPGLRDIAETTLYTLEVAPYLPRSGLHLYELMADNCLGPEIAVQDDDAMKCVNDSKRRPRQALVTDFCQDVHVFGDRGNNRVDIRDISDDAFTEYAEKEGDNYNLLNTLDGCNLLCDENAVYASFSGGIWRESEEVTGRRKCCHTIVEVARIDREDTFSDFRSTTCKADERVPSLTETSFVSDKIAGTPVALREPSFESDKVDHFQASRIDHFQAPSNDHFQAPSNDMKFDEILDDQTKAGHSDDQPEDSSPLVHQSDADLCKLEPRHLKTTLLRYVFGTARDEENDDGGTAV